MQATAAAAGRGQRRPDGQRRGHSLNLSADRLIDISQRITLSGVSNQIHLRTTQSGTPGLAPTANYVLSGPAGQAAISLSGANPLFTSNGLRHVVIQNLAQLNAVNGNLSGYYVLGSDIRGAGTVQSIGAGQGGFKGLFDGLGNKLVNLTVQNPDSVAGLFSESSARCAISSWTTFRARVRDTYTAAP